MSRGRFGGKVALVTGAGGGIGSAICSQLASEGAVVHGADVDVAALETMADKVRADGGTVDVTPCDQTDEAAVRELLAEVVDRYGSLDLCFANAGFGRAGAFLDMEVRHWRRHVDVNVTGTFLVVQAAARAMAAGGHGGAVVVTSSSGAEYPPDLMSAYCVSKAALNMLVRSTASELGLAGIRINAVMPGVVEDGMADGLLDHAAREAVEAATPLARLARPADIASVACFLASDEAAYMSGTALMIDGGQTVHAVPQWFTADARHGLDHTWQTYAQRGER